MQTPTKPSKCSALILPLTLGMMLGATGVLQAQCFQQLWAPNGQPDDMFGGQVAAYDDVVVVSAVLQDNDAGAAYVYRRQGNLWVLETELQAPVRTANDHFGYPAIHEDLIVIGARREDTNGLVDSGAAYLFRWDGAQWVQEAKLVPSDAGAGDRLGFDLAVGDDLVALGAMHDDDVGTDSGAVYVFRKVGGTWVEEVKLRPSVGTSLQAFGFGVDILDDRIFVGAPQHYQTNSDTGAVYVFRDDGGVWVEEAVLRASDGAIGDEFGNDLYADADGLAIGARGDDGRRGSCYVFRRTGTTWVEEAKVWDGGGGDWYGMGVGLRGDTLVSGAIFNAGSGSTYVYQWDGTQWIQTDKHHHSSLPSGSRFGHEFAMGDDYFVTGAPQRGGSNIGLGPGTAYIYGTCTWKWQNYATGWPGTRGVPGLTADTNAPPTLAVQIENSYGHATVGFLFWGLAKAQIPTRWGGELCVDPAAAMTPFLLPPVGVLMSTTVDTPTVTDLYVQVLQLDLGASDGMAFTPGLHIEF